MTESSGNSLRIWASVSDDVDAKIREQIQARTFTVRLKADDWASGDRHGIKTGERRIIQYLLSPITQSLDEAGRER